MANCGQLVDQDEDRGTAKSQWGWIRCDILICMTKIRERTREGEKACIRIKFAYCTTAAPPPPPAAHPAVVVEGVEGKVCNLMTAEAPPCEPRK